MNVNSKEPDDIDSAMKDNPDTEKELQPGEHPDGGDKNKNPDDVKDGSAQDGGQPLAGS